MQIFSGRVFREEGTVTRKDLQEENTCFVPNVAVE